MYKKNRYSSTNNHRVSTIQRKSLIIMCSNTNNLPKNTFPDQKCHISPPSLAVAPLLNKDIFD